MDETFYKHTLAVYQTKIMKKVIVYETQNFLAKEGIRRDKRVLQKIADISFDCSFVFTDLGVNQVRRFTRFMEWAYEETNFENKICKWKKGQYLKSRNITLNLDSIDYGYWQINDYHDWSLVSTLNSLYDSGSILFKIKRVKRMHDFMDPPTNLVMRCIVETERKSLGWDWQHDEELKYREFIEHKIEELEREGLYDRNLVNKYYYLVPIKTYTLPPHK